MGLPAWMRAKTYEQPTTGSRLVQGPPSELPSALTASTIARSSQAALALLASERAAYPDQHFWLALVPGTSEHWGHHRAPPRSVEAQGTRISPEYKARLAKAYKLLDLGIVRFLLISGGSIDRDRPDFNEAARGREHMIDAYSARWQHRGDIADRILIDPIAEHSTTNIRNADKLCIDLGIDRLLIATTMPPNPLIWPGYVPVLYQTNQGWYFLHHRLSTFDWRCRRDFDYTLGVFEWFEAGPTTDRVAAIAHHRFNEGPLRADSYGP